MTNPPSEQAMAAARAIWESCGEHQGDEYIRYVARLIDAEFAAVLEENAELREQLASSKVLGSLARALGPDGDECDKLRVVNDSLQEQRDELLALLKYAHETIISDAPCDPLVLGHIKAAIERAEKEGDNEKN